MVKIRLSRSGKKANTFYRIIATSDSKKTGGKYLEILGYYNPVKKIFKFDQKKFAKWLAVGAKPSLSLTKLINKV